MMSNDTPTSLISDWGRALMFKHSVFSVMTELIVEMLFMLPFVYNAD